MGKFKLHLVSLLSIFIIGVLTIGNAQVVQAAKLQPKMVIVSTSDPEFVKDVPAEACQAVKNSVKNTHPEWLADPNLCKIYHTQTLSFLQSSANQVKPMSSCSNVSYSYDDRYTEGLWLFQIQLKTTWYWASCNDAPVITSGPDCQITWSTIYTFDNKQCYQYTTNIPSRAAVHEDDVHFVNNNIPSQFHIGMRRECYRNGVSSCNWTWW